MLMLPTNNVILRGKGSASKEKNKIKDKNNWCAQKSRFLYKTTRNKH